MDQEIHTLEALLARYSEIEKLPDVQRIKFDDAVRTGEDPLHVVRYLATRGIEVREPDDLLLLNDDDNEEELVCFKIPEGVAATINSDASWLVFEVDHEDDTRGIEMNTAAGADGGARA
ncbi:MAG: hypothetical protein P4L83_10490 [Nevskia sp.]|nr:hypothetical protein [Nevskia sp.]